MITVPSLLTAEVLARAVLFPSFYRQAMPRFLLMSC